MGISFNILDDSAKTAPKAVFLKHFLIPLLIKRLVRVLLTNFFPRSVSSNRAFLLGELRMFSKEFVIVWDVFLKELSNEISKSFQSQLKHIYNRHYFLDYNRLNLIYLMTKYRQKVKHWFL